MLLHCLVLIVHVYTLAAQTTNGTRVHCLTCSGVAKPANCLTEVLCSAGEICSSQKYVTDDGQTLYDLKCELPTTCANAGHIVTNEELHKRLNMTGHLAIVGKKRQDMHIAHVDCEECCESRRCNKLLCGAEVGPLECYSCTLMRNYAHCNNIRHCTKHEACYINEELSGNFELLYSGGCMREMQCNAIQQINLGGRCMRCCKEHLCNRMCENQ